MAAQFDGQRFQSFPIAGQGPDVGALFHKPFCRGQADACRGAGDKDAFAAWLAGAERPVRISLRSFAVKVDTEAVLQEALLRVWQVAPRVRPDGRSNALLRFALRSA